MASITIRNLDDGEKASPQPPIVLGGGLFSDRVWPFDSDAAGVYAVIAAQQRMAGRSISQFDCRIAAIAQARGAAIATRNVRDFEDVGLRVVNPWVVV